MTLEEVLILMVLQMSEQSHALPYIFTQEDKMEYILIAGATVVAAIWASGVVII